MGKRNNNSELGALSGISPVFISGVYRAGTTLLSRIMNNHSDYYVTFDSVKYLRFCLHRFAPVADPENTKALVEETSRRIAVRWNMEIDAGKILQRLSGVEVSHAVVYNEIMSDLMSRQKPDARSWGEKINVCWSKIPQFLTMFPQGKVLHIYRDPRDVTASFKKMTFEAGYSYLDAAFNCLHAMESLKQMIREFGEDRILLIKMEDLVNRTEFHACSICNFLAIDFQPDMIDSARFTDKTGNKWQTNTAFENNMKGIEKKTRRWLDHLSPTEVLFIELICQPMMREYGYPPSGMTPDRETWRKMGEFLDEPVIGQRFGHWLLTREGIEAYPSDPVETELRIIEESRRAASTGEAE